MSKFKNWHNKICFFKIQYEILQISNMRHFIKHDNVTSQTLFNKKLTSSAQVGPLSQIVYRKLEKCKKYKNILK